MNVLILGSGGREHAIAWKIKQSPLCDKLFVAPGNGGTSTLATNISIDINDFEAVKTTIKANQIDLVLVGPEEPLVNGIVDVLRSDLSLKNLCVIGPNKIAAQLEGSKEYAKAFMNKYGIPTAKAEVFDKNSLEKGFSFLESVKPPYVLKADGLAAGKGVIITDDLNEAKSTLENLINGQFGKSSARVLIEEFLSGIELSVFVLTDGINYCILPEAKDYKRIGEGDTGLNTGGMGAISPVHFADQKFKQKIIDQIIRPTIKGIQAEDFDYRGFIFLGLINVDGDPLMIEYNVRLGDPETEAVMPRIESDLLELLRDAANQELKQDSLRQTKETTATVMMVAKGYPGDYEKGSLITIGEIPKTALVFHAGTLTKETNLKTNGGRVIAVTGKGANLEEALDNSYRAVNQINWSGANYRRDIGKDLKKMGQP